MRIEWFILAEGMGFDAKGALTVIGLNQNVLVTTALPATTKRAVIGHLVDDGQRLSPGENLEFALSIESPSGKVISANTGRIAIDGETTFPDVPATIDLPAELAVVATEYGNYVIKLEVRPPDSTELKAEVILHVLEPPSR